MQIETDAVPGELTDINNRAVVAINGVRDRLRVLLVSGEPHPGERVWRNLLKADPSVDLVHFTILRPPDKPDLTPVTDADHAVAERYGTIGELRAELRDGCHLPQAHTQLRDWLRS